MSATATCDVCAAQMALEATPLGLAMMPKTWLCTVREGKDGNPEVVDVCSTECAQAFDKTAGRNETRLEELQDGEVVTRTIEHKADN
jgi:Fe-S-cluster-containing dehydrogenase component